MQPPIGIWSRLRSPAILPVILATTLLVMLQGTTQAGEVVRTRRTTLLEIRITNIEVRPNRCLRNTNRRITAC